MAKIKKTGSQECYKVCVSKQPGAERLIALMESLDKEAVKYSKNNEVDLVTVSRAARRRKQQSQKITEKTRKRSKLGVMQKDSNHQLSMVVAK